MLRVFICGTICFLFFRTTLTGQSSTRLSSGTDNGWEKQLVIPEMSSEELNKPYVVYADHKRLENKVVKLLFQRRYGHIMKVLETKGFHSIFLYDSKKGIKKILSRKDRLATLKDFRKEMPASLSNEPVRVIEDFTLGDRSRCEIWTFTGRSGRSCELRVMFINGQITNLMIIQ